MHVRLCPHRHTVRPPKQEGNHEKATLCSQTAQSNHSGAPLTPVQPLLPTKLVCVCMHPCASRSVGPSALSDKSVWTKQRLFFLYCASHRLQHILLGSFTLTTPVQHHTFHICYLATSYVLAWRPAAVITPLLPPAPPLSLLIFISLFCVDRSRIGG